jgi:hypothetical protein
VIHVHVTDNHFAQGVRVFVINDLGDEKRILRNPGQIGFDSWETFQPNTEVEPTFALRDEESRALLEALVRHYQGAEDTRALRKDYDAALKRADAKDALVADVLRTLAGKVGA